MCWMGAVGGPGWAVAWPYIALWMLFKVALWAAVITLVVYGMRRCRGERHHGPPMTPLDILKARYARGELSRQDFETMRQDVGR
jgi:putative membrane protein